ncbi:hypothetical protein [uncultured Campylobacter sp.]|uniref:hypothetical protein n=1 Tax=uncultured Campylobacter sp. TaxID=218934 RepID=UPI00262622F8|nr:hypothetical protein [uncultured Campylobacter sp.]
MSAKWSLNFICGAIARIKFYPCCKHDSKISSVLQNRYKESKWTVKFLRTTRTVIKERRK